MWNNLNEGWTKIKFQLFSLKKNEDDYDFMYNGVNYLKYFIFVSKEKQISVLGIKWKDEKQNLQPKSSFIRWDEEYGSLAALSAVATFLEPSLLFCGRKTSRKHS